MTTVQVTHDVDERHDYRYWDAVAGYFDGSCAGCAQEAICFEGMCQACWTGIESADDCQRAFDAAMKAISRAADLFAEVEDQARIREIHSQAARVAAMGANLRLAVMKKVRASR